MALTDSEKERVRYHLGYPAVTSATMLSVGIPQPFTPVFITETAMDNLRPEAEPRVRRLLTRLDAVEERLEDSQEYLAAESVDEITLRGATEGETHPDLLEREYKRWAFRLADVLAVPIYPGSKRFRTSRSINARVLH